jgi:hypothetical protein
VVKAPPQATPEQVEAARDRARELRGQAALAAPRDDAVAGQPVGTYQLGVAKQAAADAHDQLLNVINSGGAQPEVLCQLYLWTAVAHAQLARVQVQMDQAAKAK